MEALVTQKQTSAADKLRERIAQCESADVLVNKDFVTMSSEHLHKLLMATKTAWSKFSLEIKLKLCRHKAHAMLQEKPANEILEFMSEIYGFDGVNFGEEQGQFDVLNPTFPAYLHDFVWAAHNIMAADGLLLTGEASDEDLQFGFGEASKQDSTRETISKHQGLLKLKAPGEETGTWGVHLFRLYQS